MLMTRSRNHSQPSSTTTVSYGVGRPSNTNNAGGELSVRAISRFTGAILRVVVQRPDQGVSDRAVRLFAAFADGTRLLHSVLDNILPVLLTLH